MAIPNEIAWETHNVIPPDVIKDILEKLAVIISDGEKAVREGGKFKFYVAADELPHLEVMSKLGLVQKKPERKKKPARPVDAWELTWKAWRWYALSLAKSGIGR